ncbi:MAG: CSLREA domain-containing protein [Acidobacteria bacterium]|nr:CSLREA domain-containing protein [Acidobacteriota bacterium]
MIRLSSILAGLAIILGACLAAAGATFTVTKTADTNDGTCDADCSLREAIAAAAAAGTDDTIEFSALFNTPQTITLGGTDLIITNAGTLTINGPGADKLTVSGNGQSRVFTNNTGSVAAINNLRVTGGTGTSTVSTGRGGGVYNSGGTLTLNGLIVANNTAANGGGLNNAGTATLTLTNSAVFGNTATGAGGGMQNFAGNTMNIYNSSIYNNSCNSTTTGGGAMQANGTINIVNSTFAGNTANGGSGGAIYFNGTVINITNSTVSANTSTLNGAFHKSGANPVNVRNSIFAANNGVAGSPDVTGAVASLGNNLVGNVGISTGWIASDLQNVAPVLSPLGFYGGKGLSYVPLSGSPALDAGQNCVTDLSCAAGNPTVAVTSDQRGAARPANTTVDIGAVESSAVFVAQLPTATLSQPYNFTLADNFAGYTFLLNSGGFGGVTLTSGGTSAVLGGTANQLGSFTGAVQITNGVNSTVVNYTLPVSGVGANVGVNVRVLDAAGNPVRGALVSLSGSGFTTVYAKTNSLGNCRFAGVPFGANYTLNAESKGLTFAPLNFPVNAAPTAVTLTAAGSAFTELAK